MDQVKAQELNAKYGTLLCLDVPEGSTIGIDNKIWTSGPMFKGVKMIPPGVHMFHCTASNEYGDSIMVSSSFIWVKEIQHNDNQVDMEERLKPSGQVFIKRWNAENEDFYPNNEISEQEKDSFTLGVRNFEFDKNLAPYPFDGSEIQWKRLTSHITEKLLKKILPISGIINGDSCSYDQQKSNDSSRKEKQLLDDLDVKLKEFNEKRNINKKNINSNNNNNNNNGNNSISNWGIPYFSKIPKNPKLLDKESLNNTVSISNLTKWNLDKSQALEYMLNKYYKNDEMEILGEIEFSFVLFVFGMAWLGFQQWKDLTTLFLQCDEMVIKRPLLFTEFFKVLKNQLEEAPEDMFQSDISNRVFIKPLLKQFIEACYNPETTNLETMDQVQLNLFKTIMDLKNFIENKFKWNLNLFTEINIEDDNKGYGIKKAPTSSNEKNKNEDDNDEDDEDYNNQMQNAKSAYINNQGNLDFNNEDYDEEDDEYKPVLVLDSDMDHYL
ncbi:hypothetical protein DICPUDRAFT_80783 [Dictyostelium purpureum]|uniref:AAR2-domain-containing protein n=1 Tax=Dictyostelium purpureum TaxID=5786 RepID=F0ZRI7_DICPU|nr:uncharacterized protein DICPUDRAFT_80783 [Dictyostelium purpureum]EGC33449.1 hypothetical protein DICPUDRAFT_80783 [Dictyostelium purpureum]|eukprot:XP_003290020.1 hypothetical protein DICPUDRAFT_80783 [Dictyostelium purpureum]